MTDPTMPETGQQTSVRDQMAMAALTGLLADPNVKPSEDEDLGAWQYETAVAAYEIADAMLKARAEGPAE